MKSEEEGAHHLLEHSKQTRITPVWQVLHLTRMGTDAFQNS